MNEGRAELNFSTWGRYPPAQRAKLLAKSCEEAREGEMPPGIFVLMHPAARLSAQEIDALCAWAGTARQELSRW